MSTSDQRFTDKFETALVTGASSGIGRAIARQLVESGVEVYGTSRNPHTAGLPTEMHLIQFEAASESGLLAFKKDQAKLLSEVDILINNSGSSYFGKASSIPTEVRSRQHHLLFSAPTELSETVFEHMLSRGKGAIVNVSSLAARFPIPYMEDYSASKRQLSSYTRKLIRRSEGTGMVVIDFQPGDYRTNFNNNMTRYGEADAESDRMWQQLEKHLEKGPPPEKAAMDIVAALQRGRSCTLTSGSFVQAKAAPVASQLVPDWLTRWAIRKYYRI